MWERHIKNKSGRTQEILKGKRDDVFDVLSPNADHPIYNPAGIEIKYIVESLNKRNEQAFEDSRLVGSSVNPWELFDQFFTDSFGDAIHELLIRMFDPNTVNEPQLTMYVRDCKGKEAEVTANLPSTTRNIVRNLVEKEANDKVSRLSKEVENYMNELEIMRGFIKKCHAEKLYKEFKEDKANDV